MNIASVLAQLRATTPLVHCLTNTVVPQITANVLLAAGAAPAMIDLPEEAELFAGIASAVLINVGNGSSEQHAAQRAAASAAHGAGTPWVLDPVAVGALPVRTALARDLRTFIGRGCRIVAMSALDMFPHTHHFETIAVLEGA